MSEALLNLNSPIIITGDGRFKRRRGLKLEGAYGKSDVDLTVGLIVAWLPYLSGISRQDFLLILKYIYATTFPVCWHEAELFTKTNTDSLILGHMDVDPGSAMAARNNLNINHCLSPNGLSPGLALTLTLWLSHKQGEQSNVKKKKVSEHQLTLLSSSHVTGNGPAQTHLDSHCHSLVISAVWPKNDPAKQVRMERTMRVMHLARDEERGDRQNTTGSD